MGRWHDGEGGLAHCEGIRQAHRRGEVGAARSAPDLCPALPRFGSKVNIQINARTLPTNHFPPNSSTTCFLPLRSIPIPYSLSCLSRPPFRIKWKKRRAMRVDPMVALRYG
jgi:hypothetical protein